MLDPLLDIIGVHEIRRKGIGKLVRTVLLTTSWTLLMIFGPFAFDTKDLQAPASIAPIDDSVSFVTLTNGLSPRL